MLKIGWAYNDEDSDSVADGTGSLGAIQKLIVMIIMESITPLIL